MPAFRTLLTLTAVLAAAWADEPRPRPLPNAHAHNDYEHKRPLFDALDHGFCRVEADVFLRDGKLLVAHYPWQVKAERTLEALYLDPLRERAKANGGRVYRGGPTVFLLVDVKSEGKETCAALMKALARYEGLLSVTRDGTFTPGAVTVVVSGNCDRDTGLSGKVRYAGVDGRPGDLDADAAVDRMPWVSDEWGSQFGWDGEGEMPAAQREKLRDFVVKAHRHGRLVRFWAAPEKPALWKELRAARVDLLNTDKLDDLRDFLNAEAGLKPLQK